MAKKYEKAIIWLGDTNDISKKKNICVPITADKEVSKQITNIEQAVNKKPNILLVNQKVHSSKYGFLIGLLSIRATSKEKILDDAISIDKLELVDYNDATEEDYKNVIDIKKEVSGGNVGTNTIDCSYLDIINYEYYNSGYLANVNLCDLKENDNISQESFHYILDNNNTIFKNNSVAINTSFFEDNKQSLKDIMSDYSDYNNTNEIPQILNENTVQYLFDIIKYKLKIDYIGVTNDCANWMGHNEGLSNSLESDIFNYIHNDYYDNIYPIHYHPCIYQAGSYICIGGKTSSGNFEMSEYKINFVELNPNVKNIKDPSLEGYHNVHILNKYGLYTKFETDSHFEKWSLRKCKFLTYHSIIGVYLQLQKGPKIIY